MYIQRLSVLRHIQGWPWIPPKNALSVLVCLEGHAKMKLQYFKKQLNLLGHRRCEQAGKPQWCTFTESCLISSSTGVSISWLTQSYASCSGRQENVYHRWTLGGAIVYAPKCSYHLSYFGSIGSSCLHCADSTSLWSSVPGCNLGLPLKLTMGKKFNYVKVKALLFKDATLWSQKLWMPKLQATESQTCSPLCHRANPSIIQFLWWFFKKPSWCIYLELVNPFKCFRLKYYLLRMWNPKDLGFFN